MGISDGHAAGKEDHDDHQHLKHKVIAFIKSCKMFCDSFNGDEEINGKNNRRHIDNGLSIATDQISVYGLALLPQTKYPAE